jgi:hypothetical protein
VWRSQEGGYRNNTELPEADRISIGKKHALIKYEQFTLNTSCFGGESITQVGQFH